MSEIRLFHAKGLIALAYVLEAIGFVVLGYGWWHIDIKLLAIALGLFFTGILCAGTAVILARKNLSELRALNKGAE